MKTILLCSVCVALAVLGTVRVNAKVDPGHGIRNLDLNEEDTAFLHKIEQLLESKKRIATTSTLHEIPPNSQTRDQQAGDKKIAPAWLTSLLKTSSRSPVPACNDATRPDVLDATSGVIASPLEGSTYPNRSNCMWQISVAGAEGITLHFNWFELERTFYATCRLDVLDIYVGDSAGGVHVANLCGDDHPGDITVASSDVFLWFHTDSTVSKRGFELTYTATGEGIENVNSAQTSTEEEEDEEEEEEQEQEEEEQEEELEDEEEEDEEENEEQQQEEEEQEEELEDEEEEDEEENEEQQQEEEEQEEEEQEAEEEEGEDDGGEEASPYYDIIFDEAEEQIQQEMVDEALSENIPFQCGVAPAGSPVGSRVVGGSEAAEHTWPWQISLRYFTTHICGGTIISKRWIITAGHCIAEYDGYITPAHKLLVVTGAHQRDFSATEDARQYRSVDKVVLHEEYFSQGKDIALLRMTEDLEWTDYVLPACLPADSVPDGTMCWITGWGDTEGTSDNSVLQEAQVPTIPQSDCGAIYGQLLDEHMLCAGYDEGGIDTCQGDSGGPLVCAHASGGVYVLHGVTSWGVGCADASLPGVYARMTSLISWVDHHTSAEYYTY